MTRTYLRRWNVQCCLRVCLLLLLGVVGSCSDADREEHMPEPKKIVVKPVCPVLATCQKRSRAPGDDGHWEAGRYVANEKRFEDHDDGTFTDHLTGRMWMFALPDPEQIGYGEMVKSSGGTGTAGWLFIRDPEVGSHSPAVDTPTGGKQESVGRFVAEMNAGRFDGYGKGLPDWRYPTVIELYSLFQFTAINRGDDRQYFAEDFSKRIFGACPLANFTSSTDVADADGGKFNCWLTGAVKKIRINRSRDRCLVLVRSTKSPDVGREKDQVAVCLPEVGPRKKDPAASKQWPNPRFEILTSGSKDKLADDVVIDRLTGLVWTRKSCPSGKKHWHDALDYCNDLKLGGYDDWRMPNLFEMLSIVCYGVHSPALANTAGDSQWKEADPFLGVKNESYWTSTSEEPGCDRSYIVNMKDGTLTSARGQPRRGLLDRADRMLGYQPKHFVWPVRGGEISNREQK